MKIGQFTIRFLPLEGGTERATYYLSKELVANGHQVYVVTTNSSSSSDEIIADYKIIKRKTANYPSNEKISGINVYRFPYLSFWNMSCPIISLPMIFFNLDCFDIIHLQGLNMTSNSTLLSCITSLKGRQYIITTHGVAELLARKDHSLLYTLNLYLKKAERIIALCNYEAKNLVSLGVPEDKIVIIPNGVDLKRFKNKPNYEQIELFRKKYALNKLVVLYVGRVAGNKGLEILIQAALSFKNEAISFIIVGPIFDKNYFDNLSSLLEIYGLNKKFLFTGWLPDSQVVDLYFLADIFVFPSLVDTFGLVNLDAMAAGKPIIATSTGGVPEVVIDGETGIIVKPGDYLELSKALRKLVVDEPLRKYMGEKGKYLARYNYSWENICNKTLSLYRQLS